MSGFEFPLLPEAYQEETEWIRLYFEDLVWGIMRFIHQRALAFKLTMTCVE
jgi:hypothetical protein